MASATTFWMHLRVLLNDDYPAITQLVMEQAMRLISHQIANMLLEVSSSSGIIRVVIITAILMHALVRIRFRGRYGTHLAGECCS